MPSPVPCICGHIEATHSKGGKCQKVLKNGTGCGCNSYRPAMTAVAPDAPIQPPLPFDKKTPSAPPEQPQKMVGDQPAPLTKEPAPPLVKEDFKDEESPKFEFQKPIPPAEGKLPNTKVIVKEPGKPAREVPSEEVDTEANPFDGVGEPKDNPEN